MRPARDIIIKPLISEKSNLLQEKHGNKVAFYVLPDANKVEIKLAVQEIWKVRVTKVNTLNYEGKVKRLGRFTGKRADYKKAVVTLAEGQSINFFEGA